MADISKIKIESGIYDIKDEVARTQLKPLILENKYLLFGDSYGAGYSPDGQLTSWCELFKNHFTNTTYKSMNGYGFARPNYQFYDLIASVDDDDAVTHVVIMGGYNDLSYLAEISEGINRCIKLINQKFKNAKIFIGMCAYSNNYKQTFDFYNLSNKYREASTFYNAHFIENMQYVLHNTSLYMSSDGFHPNQSGQNRLSNFLISYINNNYINVTSFNDFRITFTDDFSLYNSTDKENVVIKDFSNQIFNENLYVYLKRIIRFSVLNTDLTFNCNATTFYEIGTLSHSWITGDFNGVNRIACSLLLNNHGTYKECNGFLSIYNNKLYISIVALNETGTNYLQTKLTDIQIIPFTTTLSSSIN